MRKIAKMTVFMLCAALTLAGCGSQKAGGGGTFSQKTESKASSEPVKAKETKAESSKKEDAESAKTESDNTIYNTFEYGGLLIPIHGDFTGISDNNNGSTTYHTQNQTNVASMVVQTMSYTDDMNHATFLKGMDDVVSGMHEGSVPEDKKEIKCAGYDALQCNTSIEYNESLMKVRLYLINNTDQKKIVAIVAGPLTNMEYIDYFDKLPNLIKKANSSAATPTPTTTPAPTAAPTATPTPTATPAPTQAPADNGQVTPELKAFLDSYEAFMDQYVAFMQKYQANPTNAQLISEYSTYLDKLSDFEKKANEYSAKEGEMSTADYNYYIDTMARISKKLISASLSS